MRITSVETEKIVTHLRDEGFSTTYGEEPSTRHQIIVRVTSETGHIGTGEACPLPFWKRPV
jgi:L-alanine-DL-glutamate epimerase-like enolase superfamily enzyme